MIGRIYTEMEEAVYEDDMRWTSKDEEFARYLNNMFSGPDGPADSFARFIDRVAHYFGMKVDIAPRVNPEPGTA